MLAPCPRAFQERDSRGFGETIPRVCRQWIIKNATFFPVIYK